MAKPCTAAMVEETPVKPRLLFDEHDYELVDLVNEFLEGGKAKKQDQLRKLFDPALHARGIKELAASRERRIAYALIRLLDSLEVGDATDRIFALRALHDEILHGGRGSMQHNTARVLVTIMKHLVREHGHYWRQVQLAHDFFAAVSGRPRVIRAQLRKYFLLEMSENWNQVAFDDHVHDANTKGRKAPTHLILDAWIKGIRELTVIYYNFMTPEAIAELTEAAGIMGIAVHAGVEVSARLRGKYAQFIWVPVGLGSPRDFLAHMEKPHVKEFFVQGLEVAAHHTTQVLAVLHRFNERHLADINRRYGLDLEPVSDKDFLGFVGIGQPSVAHLADCIHQKCLARIHERLEGIGERYRSADDAERTRIREHVDLLDKLLPETLLDDYLSWSVNTDLPDTKVVTEEGDLPELQKLDFGAIIERLQALRTGSRIVLNPSNLTPADVVEALYEARGAITHIEVFNLKDYRRKKHTHTRQLALIRRTLNAGNPIALKRLLRDLMAEVQAGSDPEEEDRLRKLHDILGDLQTFLSYYSEAPLHACIGSDSIGRSHALFGMGLAVRDTLPRRARRVFDRHPGNRETIPVRAEAVLHTVWIPKESPLPFFTLLFRALRSIPGLREFGYSRKESYEVLPNATCIAEPGNILTLGGFDDHATNNLRLGAGNGDGRPVFGWSSLNTTVQNVLKVLIGFVPAFLTFFLTKDWWVLAYLGAVIWFAITGLRNIVQSVVGGGGLTRSQLIEWKDLVSWERVADSLLYTGFSVPLLDLLVKTLLLDRGLGITTTTAPAVLYTVMALANGIYLFGHNTFRGLPRSAAVGNIFRSALSIPVAIGINAGLASLLGLGGMTSGEANSVLQAWAAVIAKFASDLVAGFIEGAADRNSRVQTLVADYRSKLADLLDAHGRLEAFFPDQDVLEMLESPKEFIRTVAREAREIEVRQIINALDLMYFWMLQPRARPVFKRIVEAATPEERQIILRTQRLLERQRAVSELFLDNLVGKNFSEALAFYLGKARAYLKDMRGLADGF